MLIVDFYFQNKFIGVIECFVEGRGKINFSFTSCLNSVS